MIVDTLAIWRSRPHDPQNLSMGVLQANFFILFTLTSCTKMHACVQAAGDNFCLSFCKSQQPSQGIFIPKAVCASLYLYGGFHLLFSFILNTVLDILHMRDKLSQSHKYKSQVEKIAAGHGLTSSNASSRSAYVEDYAFMPYS